TSSNNSAEVNAIQIVQTSTSQQYSLTTNVSPSGGGSTTPSCPGGCLHNSGSQVTITAYPATGYQFNGFTGTISTAANPLTVIVNSAMTETANFTPIAVPTVTPATKILQAGQSWSFSTGTNVTWSL